MNRDRLVIAEDARPLVQAHAAMVEQVATLLGERLRGMPVESVHIERSAENETSGGAEGAVGALVFRVRLAAEVEEAQLLWERIEQDLSDLQSRLAHDQRSFVANAVEIVIEWGATEGG